jgi:hypothetical protein
MRGFTILGNAGKMRGFTVLGNTEKKRFYSFVTQQPRFGPNLAARAE